jgi:hypothetical protein
MRRFAETLVTFVILSASALGQTAKQGDASADPTVFHSPMVLEAAFAPADRSLWVSDEWTAAKEAINDIKPWRSGYFTTVEYHGLSKFSCDGVSLRGDSDDGFFWNRPPTPQWRSGLTMKQRDLGEGNIEIKVVVLLTNPKHNHDKMVMLRLDVVNGDDVVSSATLRSNVEEGDSAHRATTNLVIASTSIQPTTRLRLTMTTQDY